MKSNANTSFPIGLLFCIALGIGLFLRVHNLDMQSVWSDELVAMHFDKNVSFSEYWGRIRAYNPDHMPIYFLMAYAWGEIAGGEPYHARLFSIAIGLAAALMVYPMGRRLFGPAAGLVAFVIFVVSPNLIYSDQSLRPYSLIMLCAAASIYSFLRALSGNSRRWWLANLLANNALVWTHIGTVFVPFCQGLTLLIAWWGMRAQPGSRASFQLVLRWSLAHLSLAFAGVYWATIMMQAEPLDWYSSLTFMQAVNDVLGDNALMWNLHFDAAWPVWQEMKLGWSAIWRTLDMAGAAGVLLIGALGITFGIWTMYNASRTPTTQQTDDIRPVLFLVLLAILPPVTMATISQFSPVYLPRYTSYTSVSLSLLAGGAAMAIPRNLFRYVAIACALLAISSQVFWGIAAPAREHWLEVGKFLDTYRQSDELVVVWGTNGPLPRSHAKLVMQFNLKEQRLPITTAPCPEAAATIARNKLKCATSSSTSKVWLLMEAYPRQTNLELVRNALKDAGLRSMEFETPTLQLFQLSLPLIRTEAHAEQVPEMLQFIEVHPILQRNRAWSYQLLKLACFAPSEQGGLPFSGESIENIAKYDLEIAEYFAHLHIQSNPRDARVHAVIIYAAHVAEEKEAAHRAIDAAREQGAFLPGVCDELQRSVDHGGLPERLSEEFVFGGLKLIPDFLDEALSGFSDILPGQGMRTCLEQST